MEEFHYFLLLGQKAQNRPPTNKKAAPIPTQLIDPPGFDRSPFQTRLV